MMRRETKKSLDGKREIFILKPESREEAESLNGMREAGILDDRDSFSDAEEGTFVPKKSSKRVYVKRDGILMAVSPDDKKRGDVDVNLGKSR